MSRFLERRYATPSGLTLVGTVCGPETSDAAVVLLHGGGQTRHSWNETMQELASRGYYVIAYDARGHGDSDWAKDGDYGFATLAEDLYAVLETIPVKPVLVGASMGGMTAIQAVGASKAQIARGLVMVDVVPRPATVGVSRVVEFMRSNPQGFASVEEAAEAVRAYNPNRKRPNDVSGLMKNLRLGADNRLHWHWDPAMIARAGESIEADFWKDLLQASSRVRIPTLLVRGLQSDVVDDAGVEEFRAHLPHLEVANVADAGHMVAGDSNDAFLQALLPFVEKHSKASRQVLETSEVDPAMR